jgi:heavy metal translocating P-type ATPase
VRGDTGSKKVIKILSSLPMTAVSGLFLAVSLVLILTDTHSPADPAWAAIIISGTPLVYSAFRRLIFENGVRKISSALLITIALCASIAIGETFAAAEVAFIMAIGGILEDRTVERAKKGVRDLFSLAPAQGRRMRGGREEMIPAGEIAVGDVLRVFSGEMIPADGEIISGETSVDQSALTGESMPVDKTVGDGVYCGTISRFGSVDMTVTRTGQDTSLNKMAMMVREAEEDQAPKQRIVDRWAAWLVPTALIIAVVTYFAFGDITRAVTVLVVFCPCALVLATPTSIVAAIGQATKHGVIIKSGAALERMGKADTIAFDKTGTLTYGRPAVTDIISFGAGISDERLLSLIASAEAHSEHPLGKAVTAHAREKGIAIIPAYGFKMTAGRGVRAVVDGMDILCGSLAYLTENGIVPGGYAENVLEGLRDQGKVAIAAAADGRCIGIAALSDTLRGSARETVNELAELGTKTVLLTGDHRRTAEYFAGKAGITDIQAELLPDRKAERIKEMQSGGRVVCMVGDGVNDAPSLKTADVGVAMGGIGSDITVDAADIALMGDDISKLPYLKRLSNATIRLIHVNITISMIINFAAIAMSILGYLNPVTGALVHNAGSVLVVMNASMLYYRNFDHAKDRKKDGAKVTSA